MQRAQGTPLLRVGNNESDAGGDADFLSQVVPDLGRLLFRDWPRRLARLHVQLHNLEAEPLLRALKTRGFDPSRVSLGASLDRLEATIEARELTGLRPGLQWLRANVPSEDRHPSICHGDFFANQVFVHRGSQIVLDWSDALVGPAEIDVGILKCGIETAPVALPGLLQRGALEIQRLLVRRFLSTYRELRAIHEPLMRFGEVLRAVQTLVGISVRRLALAGVIAEKPGPHPYDSPLGVELLRSYLASAASVEVELSQAGR
jgi:aminoglycoside phosphotransferase (APT) family kinase protein